MKGKAIMKASSKALHLVVVWPLAGGVGAGRGAVPRVGRMLAGPPSAGAAAAELTGGGGRRDARTRRGHAVNSAQVGLRA